MTTQILRIALAIASTRAAPADGGNTTEVLRFFNWALHQGEPIAQQLDYAPVPRTVIDALPSLWGTLHDSAGERLWTEDR